MSGTVLFVLTLALLGWSDAFVPVLLDDPSSNTSDLHRLAYDHVQPSLLNCTEDDYTVHDEFTLLDNGSLLLTDDHEPHEVGTFLVRNGTALLCPDDDSDSYNFSQAFISCAKVMVEPHEVEVLDNGHVHVPVYHRTYPPGEFFMVENGVYVCFPKQNGSYGYLQRKDKFSGPMNVVTYVGLSVSILSLLCHLGVFCALPTVRNLPGCCLASLSLSLLVAYACFLGAGFVESDADCTPLGLCVYYFFLTSFFWMNAIAFDVWRSFRVVIRELRISSHRVPWRRFLLYSLYSWSVPGALTAAVKILDTSELLPADYRPSFGDEFCWFGQRKALLIFFAAPLIVVMVLNAAFFLDVTFVISRAQLKTSGAHEATLRKRFFMFTRLGLIMGLTWIVGLVAAYANSAVLWYVFIMLNTLQGLFIFTVFSCSSKVRGLFCKRYRKKQGGGTSVRTISQISGAV